MKKKSLITLIMTMTLSLGAVAATVLMANSEKVFMTGATERPSTMSCDYYFNTANGFTSIYDINQDLKGTKQDSYKTWGTVTSFFYSSVTASNTYIQSTDKNGNTAAILLYNCGTSRDEYPIGSVVEIEFVKSNLTLYSNLPEITGLTSIEKAYSKNPSDIIPFEITSSNWKNTTNSSSTEFKTFYSYGPRRVVLRNAKVKSVNSTSAYVTLDYGTSTATDVYLYYSSVGMTGLTTDAIKAKLDAYLSSGSNVDIYGFVQAYQKNYTSQVEILLRDENDIVESSTDVTLSNIDLSNIVTSYDQGDAFVKPTVTAYFTDGTELDVTDSAVFTGYDMSSTGDQQVNVSYTYEGVTRETSFIITVSSITLYNIVLDYNDSGSISDYYKTTGNYGSFDESSSDVTFEYYRAKGNKSYYLTDLLPAAHTHTTSLGGSIYNYDPIKDIRSIEINYSTDPSYGDLPTVYYGERSYTTSVDLPSSSSSTSYTLSNLTDVNYFKLESGDSTLYVNSINVTYTGRDTTYGSSFVLTGMGNYQYRINTTHYDGSLVSGVSQKSVPVEVNFDGSSYTVSQYKTYTYYSFDYVSEHPEVASEAAMTSPVDISNYFSVFKQFPANFAQKSLNNWNTVEAVFGSDTRYVSTYYSSSGYMQYFPYGYSDPTYHEFDVIVDSSYSKTNRSVGRIVAIETGYNLSSYGYGNNVVCQFTDDHYATFQEYSGLGYFLPRISAQERITNFSWSEPSLATPK